MAMNDEIREQWEKVRAQGWKAQLQWIIHYDWYIILIIAFVALLAGTTIYESLTNLPYVFGVLFVNADLSDDQEDLLEEGFAAYADIDLTEAQLLVDLSTSLTIGDTSTYYDYTYQSSIMARTAASQLDAWVSDVWTFNHYVNNEEFIDLREVLGEETLEKYSEYIWYADLAVLTAEDDGEEEEDGEYLSEEEARASIVTGVYELPDPDAMEDPVPYGIVVNDAPYIAQNHNYDDIVCVFGVVYGGENPETAALFLEYLFDYEAEE